MWLYEVGAVFQAEGRTSLEVGTCPADQRTRAEASVTGGKWARRRGYGRCQKGNEKQVVMVIGALEAIVRTLAVPERNASPWRLLSRDVAWLELKFYQNLLDCCSANRQKWNLRKWSGGCCNIAVVTLADSTQAMSSGSGGKKPDSG